MGYDPTETKQFTNSLYQEAGAARVRQLVNVADSDIFAQQCAIIARQTRIQLPTRHDLDQGRSKRVRAAWNHQYAKTSPVQASSLSIEPGTFLTQAGEELKMLDPPIPTSSGVVFIDADEVLSFVHSIGHKPKHLMMVVPGHVCPLGTDQRKKLHLPVRMEDQSKAVIRACCHSLGSEEIKSRTSGGDNAAVSTQEPCRPRRNA